MGCLCSAEKRQSSIGQERAQRWRNMVDNMLSVWAFINRIHVKYTSKILFGEIITREMTIRGLPDDSLHEKMEIDQ